MTARRGGKCGQCTSNHQRAIQPSEEYICEICLDYLLPPIYQCVSGHLICETCHSKVKSCPQCREPFVGKKIRNLAIEKIVRETLYECKNIAEGCQLKLKFDQLREHPSECKFVPKQFCKSLGLIACDHKICESRIADHLKIVHGIQGVEHSPSKTEIVVDIHQTIAKAELRQWKRDVVFGLPYFFLLDGHTFFLKTLVNAKEKFISWMVCTAGSSKSTEKFEAKVTYFSDGNVSSKNSVVWQGAIYSFDTKFGAIPTLSIPLKTLVLRRFQLPLYYVKTRITVSIPDSPSVIPLKAAWCFKTALTNTNPNDSVSSCISANVSTTISANSSTNDLEQVEQGGGIARSSENSDNVIVGVVTNHPNPLVARRPSASRPAPYSVDRLVDESLIFPEY